ncbi:YceI family protein [Actinoallomurus rhizosphaericola]|uniref:YceI family protein n=1 Tax=Actinoallomurus rhizosphaericola TaxID=2952536 RepID=UPI002090B322|nr:YceI family protein [Actinoallomurus rhizosphaericola]MCO5994436.1 YceI family protein [Actinoallomurus rhizosphaericola]
MTTTTTLGALSGDYVLDTAHTRIGFVARHTMGPKVRGRFERFEGHAHLDGGDPSRSSVELTIQADSLQTHNAQRDGQLRDRFLGLKDHPTITFTSTETQFIDETGFRLTGDLTIRGVTRPVTATFQRTAAEPAAKGDLRVRFTGGATIDRADWGVNWNAATRLLIGRKVDLEFDVTAIRQP